MHLYKARLYKFLFALLFAAAVVGCSANSGGPAITSGGTSQAKLKPVIAAAVSDDTVMEGETTTVTWSSEDATSCAVSGNWNSPEPLNDTAGLVLGPFTSPGTYLFDLTCTGPGGTSTDALTITVGAVAAPAVNLQLEPAAITPGSSTSLIWSTTNATACTGSVGTGSDGWQGGQPVQNESGFNTGPISATGQYEYDLSCTGPGGTTQVTRILSVNAAAPPAPPALVFTAQPTQLSIGQTSTLTWSTSNATTCTGNGGTGTDGWGGNEPLNGSVTVAAIATAGSYTYNLNCSGAGGSAAKSVTLAVSSGSISLPTIVTIDVAPLIITAGNSASLTWVTANATDCVASGSWSGAQPLLGTTVSTGTITTAGQYAYALTCSGPSGNAVSSTTLTVLPAPAQVTSLSATPTSILTGHTTSLAWSSLGATSCVASGGALLDGWAGIVGTSSAGTTVGPISIPGTYTYSLLCSGAGGAGAPQSVNVSVTATSPQPASVTGFVATPSTIIVGGTTLLSWNTNGATSCAATGGTGSDGWSGSVGTSSIAYSPGVISTAGSYTYTLTCTGPGGTGTPSSIIVNVLPLPSNAAAVTAFTALPSSIQTGQSATLTWVTTNATSCTATGGTGSDSWPGNQPTASLATNTGLINTAGAYTYTLTCSGSGGSSPPTSVVVNVTATPLPTPTIVSFTALPTTLVAGGSTVLSWVSTSATSCAATGGSGADTWTGSEPTTSLATAIGPLSTAGNYTYTLTCTGAGGTSTPSSVTVDVVAAPALPVIGAFAVIPTSIHTGGSVTATWASLDATSCTATGGTGSDGWNGSVGTSTIATVIGPITPAGNYTYTLTCAGPGGTGTPSSQTISVTDSPVPATITSFTATPSALQTGQSTALSWTSNGATSCTAGGGTGSDQWTGTEPTSSTGTMVGPIGTAGVYVYTLTCTGAGGGSLPSAATVIVTTAAPPASVVAFLATPTSINVGGSTILTWLTAGASSCAASGGTGSDGWNGGKPTSSLGTTVGPFNTAGSYVYNLTCNGAGGASAPSSVTVTVKSSTPAATIGSFGAAPSSVTVGQSSALTWTTSNASSCTATGGTGADGWSGTVGTSSTGYSVGPFATAGSVTYTLTCVGSGGTSAPLSTTVTVNPAAPSQPTVNLLVNGNSPATIRPGTSPSLSWTSTNATSCVASGGTGTDGWSGSKSTSSNGTTVGPLPTAGIYTYTLTCSGTGGSGSSSVRVTVIASGSADCGVPGVPTASLVAPAASVANVVQGICIGCGVASPGNVINAAATSPATITSVAGLLGGGVTLTVTDGTTSYPAGRQVGFELSDGSSLLNLSVLQNVTIDTYLAGVLQQSATPQNNLLHLQALGLLTVDSNAGFAGFTATKPFDALDVKVTQVAGLLSTVKVYRACVSLQ
jgi:trimeric autotransporter adhesin